MTDQRNEERRETMSIQELGEIFEKPAVEQKDVQAARDFVDRNLQRVPREAMGDIGGFYSPDHALAMVLRLGSELDPGHPEDKQKMSTVVDTARKLLKDGSREMEVQGQLQRTIMGMQLGEAKIRTESVRGEYPNVLALSTNWMRSEAGGKRLQADLKYLIKRQVDEKEISDEDIRRIDVMIQNVLSAPVSADQPDLADRKESAPDARHLAVIGLETLKRELQKHKGGQLPFTGENYGLIQLIRGLSNFRYDREASNRMKEPGSPRSRDYVRLVPQKLRLENPLAA